MDQRSPDLLRPTLTAGVLFGAVASVPFLNLINCACCALVVGCGFYASHLYSRRCRREGAPFSPGTGAMVGLVAGAFYAMTESLLETAIRLSIGDPASRFVLSLIESLNLPAENRDTIEQMLRQAAETSPTLASFVMGFFLMILIAAIFSTAGGLIGGAAFRYTPPPPPPPVAAEDPAPPLIG